jgi:hypothetical protein
MRFLEVLNRPRVVLIVAGLLILANVFLYLNSRGALNFYSAETQTASSQTASSQTDEEGYLGKVEEIQNGSVENISSINDKLRRYDALSAYDIADLRTSSSALKDYKEQAESLDPPPDYAQQHDAFSTAIGELSNAAETAYKVTSDPVSATQADFADYQQHVDSATASLKESNELLGENYKTTEGLPRVGA